MRSTLAILTSLALASCAEAPATPPPATPKPAEIAPAPAPITFLENDLPGAIAKARAEGKALFVDAWAPWCHTCLSMKNFVFTDPALAPLASRVVFLAIDTDRPEASEFLSRVTVKAWPTFYVIDPATRAVVGHWEGSGSAREMRGFIDDSLEEMRGGAKDPVSRAYAEARAAHAAGKHAEAAAAYERAIAIAPASWPGRSAALAGWIASLAGARSWAACAKLGAAHAFELRGSAAPADFVGALMSCAERLPAGPDRAAAHKIAVDRLRDLVARPHAEATIDDRQDTLAMLADALDAIGDSAGSKRAQEDRLALLEGAAKAAKAPEIAHTFDYARASTLVALGRADEAARMLEQREREMPDAYEPSARLAGVLFKAGRMPEALAAVKRAIAKSYGPRRLRYVALHADILAKMGDREGAIATLRDEVKAWEALPPSQSTPEKIADAKKRLADAEKPPQR